MSALLWLAGIYLLGVIVSIVVIVLLERFNIWYTPDAMFLSVLWPITLVSALFWLASIPFVKLYELIRGGHD